MTTLERILNALKESGCFIGDIDEAIAELKAKNERIAELEEVMKPKTCAGCRYGAFGVNGLGFEVECRIGYTCSRGREDRYDPKEQL